MLKGHSAKGQHFCHCHYMRASLLGSQWYIVCVLFIPFIYNTLEMASIQNEFQSTTKVIQEGHFLRGPRISASKWLNGPPLRSMIKSRSIRPSKDAAMILKDNCSSFGSSQGKNLWTSTILYLYLKIELQNHKVLGQEPQWTWPNGSIGNSRLSWPSSCSNWGTASQY